MNPGLADPELDPCSTSACSPSQDPGLRTRFGPGAFNGHGGRRLTGDGVTFRFTLFTRDYEADKDTLRSTAVLSVWGREGQPGVVGSELGTTLGPPEPSWAQVTHTGEVQRLWAAQSRPPGPA